MAHDLTDVQRLALHAVLEGRVGDASERSLKALAKQDLIEWDEQDETFLITGAGREILH